jgi:hypothetical protein
MSKPFQVVLVCRASAAAPVPPLLQVGVAVYQVLPREEEALSAHAPADEPNSTTRLVIPDDVISSSMVRWVAGWQVCVHTAPAAGDSMHAHSCVFGVFSACTQPLSPSLNGQQLLLRCMLCDVCCCAVPYLTAALCWVAGVLRCPAGP